MKFVDGWALIAKAAERKQENRAFELYAASYPHFTKENFVTFDKFYKKKSKNVTKKTKEEILADVIEIRRKYKKLR